MTFRSNKTLKLQCVRVVILMLYVFSTVLVYRLGGSSVDATLVEVNSGMFRIIASKVDHNLGGASFDEVLVDLFTQEFYR